MIKPRPLAGLNQSGSNHSAGETEEQRELGRQEKQDYHREMKLNDRLNLA